MSARKPAARGMCISCERPMRGKRVPPKDAPGTVPMQRLDLCQVCYHRISHASPEVTLCRWGKGADAAYELVTGPYLGFDGKCRTLVVDGVPKRFGSEWMEVAE